MEKVRTELEPHERMDPGIRPFEQMFLCKIVGVVLRPRSSRGLEDRHICSEVYQCGWRFR